MKHIPDGPVDLSTQNSEGTGSSGRAGRAGPVWLSETLITRAQYHCFDPNKGRGDAARALLYPVDQVTWLEAKLFARWLFGGHGRLPHLREWIRAARGASSDPCPWGDDTSRINDRCNTASFTDMEGTTPVNRFDPHGPYKLRDLGGNLFEWTEDPAEEGEGPGKIIAMGGSHAHMAGLARCSSRFPLGPDTSADTVGFRVALPPEHADRFLTAAEREHRTIAPEE
jgi:formylglycine-generating enzyme required for sulfatase activity